ncbi:unnamed protein product [Fusarium venenatum]|uniref:Uncharacterized protein n=1 Tax=Fusarium venenatum TaxID=56646 RepID=A0A2L2T811_9HYPO|nr:uncharacterized protein FVRRES_02411 [Fusarium venenatum]CEI65899.1 unnamed protein product [Fusarium venenatum]
MAETRDLISWIMEIRYYFALMIRSTILFHETNSGCYIHTTSQFKSLALSYAASINARKL